MKKEKLSKRIVNAVRALRGEPWPVMYTFEAPRIQATHHRIKVMNCMTVYGPIFEDGPAREDIERTIRRDLAAELGRQLLEDGALEITTEEAYPNLTRHGCPGHTRITARVRVAMPEEDAYGKK